MQFKRTVLFLNVAFIAIGFAYFGRSNNRLDEAGTALWLGQIHTILSQSEIGRSALAQAEQYEVKIQFKAGQGTVYHSINNTMTIDAAHSPERAALSFVHEMVHARYHHEGIRPAMMAIGREAYVEARVLEEAMAVALAIEAKIALEAAGVEFGEAHPPLENPLPGGARSGQEGGRGPGAGHQPGRAGGDRAGGRKRASGSGLC